MAFWIVWDHLGVLMVLNLGVVLGVMLPGSVSLAALGSGDGFLRWCVGLPVGVFTVGVLAPVGLAGLAAVMVEIVETHEGRIWSFFRGIRSFGWRATGAGLVLLGCAGCLGLSGWFYAARLGAGYPWLGYGLSAASLWMWVFLVICMPLVWPALVLKRAGVLATLKVCGALVLDNPGVALGLAAGWLGLAVASVAPPLLLLVTPAAGVALSCSAYELLARKYEGVVTVAAEDDYLNRGIRDVLFPWKG